MYKYDDYLLKDLLIDWLDVYSYKLSRNTYNGYCVNVYKHIIPNIGHIKVSELEPLDIEFMYRDLISSGLSSTTVLYVHNTLRSCFTFSFKKRMISDNIMNYVDSPKKRNFKPNVLTADEISSLLTVSKDLPVFLPIVLALFLGLRRGEVLGLKWSDVDFNNKSIAIQRTLTRYKNDEYVLSDVKTSNSERVLLLPDSVLDILKFENNRCLHIRKVIFGYNPNDLIITDAKGDFFSPNVLDNNFKFVLSKAGITKRIRFHDLRHTNATLLLKNNIPAKIVSSMLGHSSVGITLDIYSHVLTNMQEPAVTVLDDILHECLQYANAQPVTRW